MVPLIILITSCSFIILELNHQARALAFSRHFRSSPRSPPRPPSSLSPAARSGRRRHRDLLGSSRDDDDGDGDGDGERRRGRRASFRDVEVAGVSVSPVGFLALLRSSTLAAVPDHVGGIIGDGGNDGATIVAYPIFLTSPPPPPPAPSSSAAVNYSSGGGGGEEIPAFFSRSSFAPDSTSATSPEALTFLQLLNGVDMANVLPPDALGRACAYYAFSLLERDDEENGEEGEGGKATSTPTTPGDDGEDDVITEVEDELGLDRATVVDVFERYDDDDARGNKGDDRDRDGDASGEYKDALDYVRAVVGATLPPDADGNYIDASPRQRSRAQLPRVWLRGVRLEEVCELPAHDGDDAFDRDNDDDGTRTDYDGRDRVTTTDAGTIIGRVPVRYVLECSVDDGAKLLEIPLHAIPSSSTMTSSSAAASSPCLRQRRLQEEMEISSDILQELSQNYNIETSAPFIALSLFHRYTKSGIVSAAARSSFGVPTLRVSNRLLRMLEEMQRNQDREKMTSGNGATADGSATATTRYCWVLSAADSDRNRGEIIDNDAIETIIQSNGLPLYRPLSRIQREGTLRGGGGDSGSGGSRWDTDKKPSLNFEQQSKQLQLQSAWKIAMQKEDAGALGRIRKAMEELEREVMMMEVGGEGKDEEGGAESSTLMTIRRAMMRDGVNEDVVGLMSDLEEAAMIDLDTDNE